MKERRQQFMPRGNTTLTKTTIKLTAFITEIKEPRLSNRCIPNTDHPGGELIL